MFLGDISFNRREPQRRRKEPLSFTKKTLLLSTVNALRPSAVLCFCWNVS